MMPNEISLKIAFAALMIPLTQVKAQTAVYDPASGSIVLNDVSNVGSLVLTTRESGGSDSLVGGNANSLGGIVSAAFDNQKIAWIFFSALDDGPFDLGPVAQANVLQSTLDDSYRLGITIAGASCGGACYYVPISGGLVPEPSTLLLLGISMFPFAGFRRRP